MATIIEDGTGKGYSVEVDSSNRLRTRSINEDSQLESAELGESFYVGTPFLTQTSASENGLLYIKSEETLNLFAKTFSSQGRFTTGGTFNNYLIQIYKGIDDSALTGTWVDINPLNVNFGSNQTLSGVFKYGSPAGATGFTGTPVIQLGFPINVYNQITTSLIVPKGVGLLVTVIPPTSNTSMPVNFGLILSKLRNLF